jgi:hypothetical protein
MPASGRKWASFMTNRGFDRRTYGNADAGGWSFCGVNACGVYEMGWNDEPEEE